MRNTLLSFILIILVCLSACSDNNDNNNSSERPYDLLPSSKDYVSEFMSTIKKAQSTGDFSGYKFEEKFCYNVTTENVRTQTNAKIFKFSDSCASFVLIDDKVYELCQSLGGYGFINAVPCDFDNDGNKDLLISSSFGSGTHRSEISVFNTKTKQSTVVYDTLKTENPDVDLIVLTSTQVRPNVPYDELPTRYEVCTADFKIPDNDFVNINFRTTLIIGCVEAWNTIPVFFPE